MNRNQIATILMIAGAFALMAQTRATTITDTFADADKYNLTGAVGGGQSIAGGGGTFTGNFDIVNTDSDLGTFTVSGLIYSASLGGSGDIYNSTLGFDPKKEQVTDGVAKFWFHDTAHNKFTVDLELDDLAGNGGKVVVLGESIGLSVIAQLNINGKVDYLVTNNGTKPVKLDYAYLGVNVESIPAVPDGGTTAMLLGFGLLGIAGLRRKLS